MKLTCVFAMFLIAAGASQPGSASIRHLARTQTEPLPTAAEARSTQKPDFSYKIDATLVNIDVMVTDDDGRVLTGLKRGNFRILDNGVPQDVVNFAPTSTPITIVVLMEYSAASSSYFAGKAAEWGTGFLSHLQPKDWVALTTFDLRPKVRVDFTHSQYEIRDAIGTLGFPEFREVNLHDALIETLDKLEGVRGRKSILLFATGLNSFSAASFDEVRERLRRTDTVIFCVGLAESEYLQYGGTSMTYIQGKSALTSYAKQTGGLALFPRFEGELPDMFRSVVGFLRSEYTLTFRPAKDKRDGQFHRLKVEIVGPDGKLLKVTDEKGKQHKVEVYAREGYVAPKN
jgi:Ca-activated chloride channel family protein